jgi:hypothetical protein
MRFAISLGSWTEENRVISRVNAVIPFLLSFLKVVIILVIELFIEFVGLELL